MVLLAVVILLGGTLFVHLALAPASADAATADNTHLVNPVSIVVGGTNLFIADNITDSDCVVNIFSIADAPVFLRTLEFSGNINRLRYVDGKLFILFDKYYYTLSSATAQPTRTDDAILDIAMCVFTTPIVQDITDPETGEVTQDITYITSKTWFYLRQNGIYRDNFTNISIRNNGIQAIIGHQQYLEVLSEANGSSTVEIYNLNEGFTFGIGYNGETAYNSAFLFGETVFFGNATQLYNYDLGITIDIAAFEIIDADSAGETILVLTSQNQVHRIVKVGNEYITDDTFVIGSDIVETPPPALDFVNRYTLVTSTGYPTNIVYKTVGANSVTNLVDGTGTTQFIVLGYPGDHLSAYYYVFYQDHFGWVKKTGDGIVANDKKLTVVDTAVSEYATYSAKLLSANAVNIYLLPYDLDKTDTSGVKHSFSQTPEALTTVNLLQEFSADGQSWYYVSYRHSGSERFGFVKKGDVGMFTSTASVGETVVLGRKKINSPLSDDVYVYLTEEMNADELTVDSVTGEAIKLKTGKVVSILEEGERASYIEIVYPNGTVNLGWVNNQYLISADNATDNLTVGIIIVCSALGLGIVLLVIVKARKKGQGEADVITIE
jgi:hypothetical protein